MTTGFDLIFNSLRLSRKRSSPTLEIPADGAVLAMLGELAQTQEQSVQELTAKLLKKAVTELYQASDKNIGRWETLSERQQEVAALACLAYTNAEIAERLDIGLETVKTHMKEILRKFEVRGRHQLRYLLRRWDFNDFEDDAPSV
ncbi:MAG: hypothetical protein ISR58_16900 [Anaerolineales bacterium]|nr:hypothetical protein [Chloroflexota bacterium]MBL6982854.1 hypothetical protein [Anaerolineales bacterium]